MLVCVNHNRKSCPCDDRTLDRVTMSAKTVLKMGSPELLRVAKPVLDPADAKIRSLLRDMQDTIESMDANGLAAPQIGIELRVVLYRVPRKIIPADADQQPVPWTCMINPVVTPIGKEMRFAWERCLSVPGLYGKVLRHRQIVVTYKDLDGVEHQLRASGFHAMLLQHECDHLDGVLYPTRMKDMTYLVYDSTIEDGRPLFDFSDCIPTEPPRSVS